MLCDASIRSLSDEVNKAAVASSIAAIHLASRVDQRSLLIGYGARQTISCRQQVSEQRTGWNYSWHLVTEERAQQLVERFALWCGHPLRFGGRLAPVGHRGSRSRRGERNG